MTKAERLRHPCPTCNAKPGAPCVDRLGDELKRGHVTRGPGALEKHKTAEAARINARAVASYGPLFADLAAEEVAPVTAAELIERDRLAAARSFDSPTGPEGMAFLRQCNKGMQWLYVHHVGRALAELAGEAGAELARHAAATYPLDYQRMMLRGYMTTTDRHQVGPYRVPSASNPLGFVLAFRFTWGPTAPLMTPAEFDARFPALNHWTGTADQAEPASAADLFEQMAEALRRNREATR